MIYYLIYYSYHGLLFMVYDVSMLNQDYLSNYHFTWMKSGLSLTMMYDFCIPMVQMVEK